MYIYVYYLYEYTQLIEPSPAALSADLATIVWKESERLVEKILLTTAK
jgi:hypothetical protein